MIVGKHLVAQIAGATLQILFALLFRLDNLAGPGPHRSVLHADEAHPKSNAELGSHTLILGDNPGLNDGHIFTRLYECMGNEV